MKKFAVYLFTLIIITSYAFITILMHKENLNLKSQNEIIRKRLDSAVATLKEETNSYREDRKQVIELIFELQNLKQDFKNIDDLAVSME